MSGYWNYPKPCGCLKPCACALPPVKPAPETCYPGWNRPRACGWGVPPPRPALEPCYPTWNRPKPCGCVKPCGCAVPTVLPAPEPCYPGPTRPKPCAVIPVKPVPEPCSPVEWIATTPQQAECLTGRAVVAGYENTDGSPLWVIRAYLNGDLLPGKLIVKQHVAYVSHGGQVYSMCNIEVCCICPENVRWEEDCNGNVPCNAVVGGKLSTGELLYIGRAREQCSLTPGMIYPSHGVVYISHDCKEIACKNYEVLCVV